MSKEANIRTSKKTRVNDQILEPKVRLIDSDGNQAGIMSASEALVKAKSQSLDLVEISPNAEPPVCRIMDYGKYLFDLRKRKGASKKKQKKIQVKEIKFRPATDIGDYKIKLKKILEFLERGDKVKVEVRFRGRELQHKQLGLELTNRVKSDLPEGHVIEQEPKLEGKQMSMVIAMGKTDKPK